MNFAHLRKMRLFCLFLATLFASQTVYAAAVQVLSNTPMATALSLPPNLAVTLDDSGSMAWAYAPDSVDSANGHRWAYSSSFNSMYYNPNTQYVAPVNASGTSLSTSFTHAYINGFDTTRGWVDLSKSYRS
ncbi:MAG: hypothetical protein HGA47_02655, partial [Zoogloea sp.]|nr:hypothetical protein [Zoogloea sp.]